MLIVSLPHDMLVDLNSRYWVYDTDDGVAERHYATDIVSMKTRYPDLLPNVQLGHYGGMLLKQYHLPDGKYPIRDKGFFMLKNGLTKDGVEFMINENQGVYKAMVVNINN